MISVVIITKNEASNISECLASCSFADEIIIVDAESTDDTIKLANTYTDKIYIRPFISYADAKNFGIEQANGEWILSIDADERLTEASVNEIRDVVQNNSLAAYYIPRLTYFCGTPLKRGGCYPDWQLRLFKKSAGRFSDVKIHEGVKVAAEKKVGYLKQHLLHYSYRNLAQYWEKFNRYTSLAAQQKFLMGKRFHLYHGLVFFWALFYRLILKLGIFDGMRGCFYHIFSAVAVFVKYAKLWELQNNHANDFK